MDTSRDGAVSMGEFTEAIARRKKAGAPKQAQSGSSHSAAWDAILAAVDGNDKFDASVQRLFTRFDADGSGEISVKELAKGLKGLGVDLNEAEVSAWMAEVDSDFSGAISLREFKAAIDLHRPHKGSEVAAWVAVLAKIDANPAEWERSISRAFRAMDTDGSGEVNTTPSEHSLRCFQIHNPTCTILTQVDVDELQKGLRKLGVVMTDAQVAAFKDEIDTDKDGRLTLAEFTAAVEARKPKGASKTRASSEESAWSAILAAAGSDPSWERSLALLFKVPFIFLCIAYSRP